MEQSNYRKNLNELTHTCTTAHTGKQVESQSVQPEMGEVDALVESYSFSSSRQGCKEKFLELADLARRYAAALAEERKRADELKHLLRRMLGAVITVRLENTPEWMEYMAEVVNEMNAAIGEADRVEIHGDGIRILAICGKEVG